MTGADRHPESEPVVADRELRLLERGIPYWQAERLADQIDVVHEVDRLLGKGCPPDKVYEIVR